VVLRGTGLVRAPVRHHQVAGRDEFGGGDAGRKLDPLPHVPVETVGEDLGPLVGGEVGGVTRDHPARERERHG
jgi:hypothetical protein